jgi:peroxiredoxin
LTKNFDEIESRNTVVFAISTDDLSNATSLAGRAGVRFPILYNPSGDVVKQYDVLTF